MKVKSVRLIAGATLLVIGVACSGSAGRSQSRALSTGQTSQPAEPASTSTSKFATTTTEAPSALAVSGSFSANGGYSSQLTFKLTMGTPTADMANARPGNANIVLRASGSWSLVNTSGHNNAPYSMGDMAIFALFSDVAKLCPPSGSFDEHSASWVAATNITGVRISGVPYCALPTARFTGAPTADGYLPQQGLLSVGGSVSGQIATITGADGGGTLTVPQDQASTVVAGSSEAPTHVVVVSSRMSTDGQSCRLGMGIGTVLLMSSQLPGRTGSVSASQISC